MTPNTLMMAALNADLNRRGFPKYFQISPKYPKFYFKYSKAPPKMSKSQKSQIFKIEINPLKLKAKLHPSSATVCRGGQI
ncbi:hypothetical protein KFK09_015033 [Dendrobium nobile]|uniref:Uncharacterized protein n=1 Tax=Dendrobium nobile TaxID=94219 RepID=A0A8T3B9G7_DENNO|nr:hypothetical protein KFK09_015033 [Dendrobium nobile]